MAFNSTELGNIANSALDYFLNRGSYFPQTIARKPLLEVIERKAKTFPGGKGSISLGVKGIYGHQTTPGTSDYLKGYTHTDAVTFYNPGNMFRANYLWREMHLGITVSHTEMKMDGLSVDDDNAGVSQHSERELTALVNLWETKLEDMAEQYARSLTTLLWSAGTADPLGLHGVRLLVADNPLAGVVGGQDAATTGWWRNRARTAAYQTASGSALNGPIASNPANGGALLEELQKEYRQLIRYGGKPDAIFAGSDFIGAMEKEMRANGLYTQSGFRGTQDAAMGQLNFMGMPVQYEPWLDGAALPKRMYWLDTSAIVLHKMEAEWRRTHAPARVPTTFVLQRSITCTGQLICTQRNSSGVYDIA